MNLRTIFSRQMWAAGVLTGVALSGLATAKAPAAPRTFHVRVDGGSAAQCTGLSDAPYVANGKAASRNCAWRHPFEALPPGGEPRIFGGDTLIIGPGQYLIGKGAPGTEHIEKCDEHWPWDCHTPALPSGPSPQQPTRILGAGFDRGCTNAPQLWGNERVASVLDLTGSSNVEVACLDITDHSDCIEFHCRDGATCMPNQTATCPREKSPFGAWAGVGIVAADSNHVSLHDLDIHGLAHTGIQAGRISDWTIERVRIRNNGWVGWDGDLGSKGSSNSGTLLFRDVEIAWNGCGERHPSGEVFGCWAQVEGGYGDGLGTAKTGGHWRFENVRVHDNTSDGIDLLYADGSADIDIKHLIAWNNAGNQLKVTGSARVEDSELIGSCAAFDGRFNMSRGDLCRAEGNTLALNVGVGHDIEVARTDLRGEGDCIVELGCAGDRCGTGSKVVIAQGTLAGLDGSRTAAKAPCMVWVDPKAAAVKVTLSSNAMCRLRRLNCVFGVAHCEGNTFGTCPEAAAFPVEVPSHK